jgi:hypothetical protein
MASDYPEWQYDPPRNTPPPWVRDFISVAAEAQHSQ